MNALYDILCDLQSEINYCCENSEEVKELLKDSKELIEKALEIAYKSL